MIGEELDTGWGADDDDSDCTDTILHREGLMQAAATHETVRTSAVSEPAAAEPASKRFELRLTALQLARWRTIAAEQGVSLADLVRFAVDELAAALPAGHIAAERRRAFEALVQALRPSQEPRR